MAAIVAFSVAANVISLADVVFRLGKATFEIYGRHCDLTPSIPRLVYELQALMSIISHVQIFLRDFERSTFATEDRQVLPNFQTVLTLCQSEFRELRNIASEASIKENDSWLERVRKGWIWAAKEKRVEDASVRLHRLATSLTAVLSLTGRQQDLAIRKEVQATRQDIATFHQSFTHFTAQFVVPEWIIRRIKLSDELLVSKTNLAPSLVRVFDANEHAIQRNSECIRKMNTRVIDIIDMRLVDLPSAATYSTLSYALGNAKQFHLISETENILRQHKGLALFLPQIPKTIQDAIRVTLQLGERFLWVDSLCIRHDDDLDKATQVKSMGKIYAEAVVCIIAASGEDASHGLPGVRRGSRTVE